MKRDFEFLKHLMLVAAGILAVGGFVLLMLLLKPKDETQETKVIEPSSQFDIKTDRPTPVYFEGQNLFASDSFAFGFYYPKDWLVSNNGEYKKDDFLTVSEDEVINGWIISTFNNPDYQLGKQAALVVKVIKNPKSLILKEWLSANNSNLLSGGAELNTLAKGGVEFYQVVGLENQVYAQLPSWEVLVLTAPCGQYSNCVGDKEKNQQVFETILSSLNLKKAAQP